MAGGARTPESHIWERRGMREEGEGMQRKIDLELGSSQGPWAATSEFFRAAEDELGVEVRWGLRGSAR